jgi:ribosomal protein S12 methylthiotransferase
MLSRMELCRMARPYRVCVVSLGCPKNLVDTEVMCGSLASAGFQLTADREAADLLLVNTCSFIRDARDEAQDEIIEALRWKRRAPGRRRVAVAGCLPQRDPGATARAYPDVDLFLGLDDVPEAARLVRELSGDRGQDRHVPSGQLPTYLYDHTAPRLTLTPASHAYLKIAEGCDHRCAYCSIPAIRGRQRSRSLESLLEECRQLLGQGAAELNLIAQDTSRYGLDRDDGASLPELVRRIDALPGTFWVRVLYTHPRYVTDSLIDTLAGSPHTVPYLDIPLQHISDGVLKAMRRGLGGRSTRALMERLRERWPGVAVRTTFLVGFPGETERDFEELLAYATEYRFDRLGVFAYSAEAGTPAAGITEGLVPPGEATSRRDALMARQQAIATELNQALVGRTLPVIADVEERPGRYRGRTMTDAPEIDNRVQFRGPRGGIPGHLTRVRIDRASAYDLTGTAL